MKTCPKHGEYEPKTMEYFGMKIETQCPACEAEHRAAVEAEEAAREAERAKIRAASERERLEHIGIMPRFASASFDSYVSTTPEQEHVLRVCRAYAERHERIMSRGTSLIMLGMPGTGKNHLATAILREYDRLDYRVRMLKLAEMVREIRATYAGAGNEAEAVRKFAGYDLLIVNEVGVQSGSDAERNLIFEIFDDRYDRMKPTIVISNQDIEGLKKFLGDRIVDRLGEKGGMVLQFTWGSYRKTA